MSTSKEKPGLEPDAEHRDFASPACSMHEVDPAYMFAAKLEGQEILELLNVLLESERAGAEALLAWQRTPAPGLDPDLLATFQRDEAGYAAGLARQIRRLGGTPSRATGRFFEKAARLDHWPDRFNFLNRGQLWVAERIAEALPRLEDPELVAFLKEMHERHMRNIERASRAL